MNPFESPLSQFVVLESMIQFYAPLDVVSEKLYQAWTKWHLNGLGEAFGFCLTRCWRSGDGGIGFCAFGAP